MVEKKVHIKTSGKSYQVLPFFHCKFYIGQQIIHVVIWQNGRGSIPSDPDQVLKLWKHHQTGKSKEERPILKKNNYNPDVIKWLYGDTVKIWQYILAANF